MEHLAWIEISMMFRIDCQPRLKRKEFNYLSNLTSSNMTLEPSKFSECDETV